MRVAINTRFLLSSRMEGFGWFTYETVKRMVEHHPEVEFIFFFDRPYDKKFIFGSNVTAVVLKPQARHPVLFKIWFNYSVTRALKKYKADVFFSPDGYLSLKTDTPQIGVIHDLNFEHFPEDISSSSARKYLKKYFPLFAKKAHHIITVSEYSKQDIVALYKVAEDKITVTHNGGSDAFKRLTNEEIEAVKLRFTEGEDYFVFVGSLHPRKNLNRLFAAFEKFKTETGSSTQLLIVGEKLWKDNRIEEDYNNNSFKAHIRFTGHLSLKDLTKAVGGAKYLVFPSYFEGFGIPIVEAMKAGTPVCCGNKTSLPEVAADAAVYFDPYDTLDIAKALQRIDTDNALREELIRKGQERAKLFSWDFTARKIWSVIEDVAAKTVN
jgi:glycosyltransferase involved in cell wall biosynthesis